jgi:hypothetical protein
MSETTEEPWRRHVAEVSATVIECRAALAHAGIQHSAADLILMARLCLAREYGWPSRGDRSPPSD